MDCPYCGYSAPRISLHQHMLDNHGDQLRKEGRNYVFSCPECGKKTTIEPGSGAEPDELVEKYGTEVRMIALDRLLDHLENEHGY